jgi:hypothetical protein
MQYIIIIESRQTMKDLYDMTNDELEEFLVLGRRILEERADTAGGIDELMDMAFDDGIGYSLIRANLLSQAGENIWVVWTESSVTVETFDSSECPAGWRADVIRAVHWGRAIGWESQCAEDWGYSLDEDTGLFVFANGGETFENEADATRFAFDNGHYPELCDDAIERLRDVLRDQENL